MAKLKGQELVNRFIDSLGLAKGAPGDGSASRTLAINALNTAHGKIARLGSMIWLQVWTTITQGAAVDYAMLPAVPAVEHGKKALLGQAGTRRGTLIYLGPNQILSRVVDQFGAWATDRPTAWTWGADAAGVVRIQFD